MSGQRTLFLGVGAAERCWGVTRNTPRLFFWPKTVPPEGVAATTAQKNAIPDARCQPRKVLLKHDLYHRPRDLGPLDGIWLNVEPNAEPHAVVAVGVSAESEGLRFFQVPPQCNRPRLVCSGTLQPNRTRRRNRFRGPGGSRGLPMQVLHTDPPYVLIGLNLVPLPLVVPGG